MNTQIFLNGITVEQLAEEILKLFLMQTTNEPQQPENDLMTREAVCKLLSITKVTLWKHTRSGKLKSVGIGNRVLYYRSDVLQAVKPLKD